MKAIYEILGSRGISYENRTENVKTRDIERRSFEIITEELGDRKLDPDSKN